MMLLVTFPDNCHAARFWISAVVLGEFLGVAYRIRFCGEDNPSISADGRTLELSDAFFIGAKDNWLLPDSMPAEPLQRWRDADHRLDAGQAMPVLFGAAGFEVRDTGDALLKLDIFGSAFFMLSRYEEAVARQRDIHNRFPASASLAYRENFLARPVVDEYVEILWHAMSRLWPRLQRKERRFGMRVTCDVDSPYHPSAASFPRLIKRMAGEAIRRRSFPDALRPARNYFASRRGNWRNDPFYPTVDWMMDVNEAAGNKMAFYFIPEITDTAMDDTCLIDDPAVTDMLGRIARRGHEIGIHPGYHTYDSGKNLLSGKQKLQRALEQARIPQRIAGGRQHYLRWSTRTPALWENAALEYDSTLGYADRAGFRCGTCHDYSMFDLHSRRALKLRQHPLICMECSVIDYMGYGCTEAALAAMIELKRAAQRYGGNFTLLWHNSYFEADGAREIYCEVIT